MRRLQRLAGVAALALVASCTHMTPQQQGTLSGAAMGAAGGAGIATITGGDPWTGATIGGLAGAVAGNIHGTRQQQRWRGW